MNHVACGTGLADLSTLSLDAAVQLDLIERHKTADLGVLTRLLVLLEKPDDSGSDANPLNLQDRPLDVDIFNSAIHRIESTPVVDVSELQSRVQALMAKMRAVAEGKNTESVNSIKRFCLSLHQALLSANSPFHQQDEWVLMRDERLA